MVGFRFWIPAALVLVASAGARPAGRVSLPKAAHSPASPARSRRALGSTDDGEVVHAIARPNRTRAVIFERA